MTIDQQTEERLDNDEQPTVWEGAPLALRRDFGDMFWRGLLSNLRLPARHTHPKVREAAEGVQAAEAELSQLRVKHASRDAERSELMQSARYAPDRAEQLQRFESETAVFGEVRHSRG